MPPAEKSSFVHELSLSYIKFVGWSCSLFLVSVIGNMSCCHFIEHGLSMLQDFSTSWDIKATPTFFFLKDGQQVDKLVGANKPELQKKIAAITDSVPQRGQWKPDRTRPDRRVAMQDPAMFCFYSCLLDAVGFLPSQVTNRGHEGFFMFCRECLCIIFLIWV